MTQPRCVLDPDDHFPLDMKSEGVEVKPLRELTGNEMFNTVYIDDVVVSDEFVLGEVNRGWEVSRNTLTAERVSIGGSDANFIATLPEFVEFVRDGQFDHVAQHRAGQFDRRRSCRQGAESALDAVDAGRWRCHAVGSDLQAVVDVHRPRVMPNSRCPPSAPTPQSATPMTAARSGAPPSC